MSDPIDCKLADNLRRWHESGQPQHWCDARRGRWDANDRLALVSSLWWSEYWPMEPAAIDALLDTLAHPWNLGRWRESGQPWQWVDAHGGEWDDAEWQALLDTLGQSEFWPLDPAAVGALLAEVRGAWHNLQRWQASGQPERWVGLRQGCWDHGDWLALVDTLRQSAFWPLDLAAVGRVLEGYKQRYLNLVRWQLADHPRRWVEARQGQWDEAGWQALLAELAESEFWPLNVSAVARVLEGMQREWWNLRRWRDAGLARRWVAERQGQWGHDDWLGLLASLRASGYWPVEPAALGAVLEEARTELENLRRWQASGEPQHWVAAHAGRWDAADLDALLDDLAQSGEFWPLDARGVQGLVEELDRARANLKRWRDAGHAARWVAAHADGWDHAAWLELLDDLRQTDYWPLAPEALGRALEREARRPGGMRTVARLPAAVPREVQRRAA